MTIAMIFRVSRSSFSTTNIAETSVIRPKLKAGSVSFSMFQICFKQGAVDPSFLFSFTQIVYYVDTSLHLTVDVTTRHARKLSPGLPALQVGYCGKATINHTATYPIYGFVLF